jgi:hypothetical protein
MCVSIRIYSSFVFCFAVDAAAVLAVRALDSRVARSQDAGPHRGWTFVRSLLNVFHRARITIHARNRRVLTVFGGVVVERVRTKGHCRHDDANRLSHAQDGPTTGLGFIRLLFFAFLGGGDWSFRFVACRNCYTRRLLHLVLIVSSCFCLFVFWNISFLFS